MEPQIIYPVLVHVALTFFLLTNLAFVTARNVKNVRPEQIQDDNSNWPLARRRASNAYGNQFEMPLLFYAAAAFAVMFRLVDQTVLIMAWIFAVARLVQALNHITANVLAVRSLAFFVGSFAVAAMWAYIGWRIISATA